MEFKKYLGKYATSADVQSAIDNATLNKPYVAYLQDEDRIDWNSKEETDYLKIPFTIEVLESRVNIQLRANSNLSYKINDGEWNTLSSKLTLNTGNTYSLKGSVDITSSIFNNLCTNLGQKIKLYGNVMSLVAGDNYATATDMNGARLYRLINVNASMGMIDYGKPQTDITDLILPATTLAESCYNSMFAGSGAFTRKTIVLPAPTLANECYAFMFRDCSNLNSIKCLATDIPALACTSNWVNGVANSGTFVTPASTTWASGVNGIPSGWTRVDA